MNSMVKAIYVLNSLNESWKSALHLHLDGFISNALWWCTEAKGQKLYHWPNTYLLCTYGHDCILSKFTHHSHSCTHSSVKPVMTMLTGWHRNTPQGSLSCLVCPSQRTIHLAPSHSSCTFHSSLTHRLSLLSPTLFHIRQTNKHFCQHPICLVTSALAPTPQMYVHTSTWLHAVHIKIFFLAWL